MCPRILAVLVGCADSSSSNRKQTPAPTEEESAVVEQIIDTGTYGSTFIEKSTGFTYREQITFSGDGSFEFVDYETLDETGKITSYTKFLGPWWQGDSSSTLSKGRRIYHTTFPDETSTDELLDPPTPQVLGAKLRITSDTSFSLLASDGVRVEYAKAAKIQFAF